MSSSMIFRRAPSSSSSFTHGWTYDVFLSFRGQDTRDNFTAHLCSVLRQKGFHTYMDDKLRGGEEISPALLKAIGESNIAIVVLSENYASSAWCLNELKEILECKEKYQQIVLPVFYKIDPSDVRHQKKSFGEALAKHESRSKKDTVQSWKTALQKVANLSGYHLDEGNESIFIHEIVQAVSRMVSHTYLNVAKYPVGLESRVQDINVLLSIGMNDIRMVGIFGGGGIGKTTIAKAIYNSIAYQFEDSCFLANVRENSKRECGLVQLQETLLSDILGDSSLKIRNVDRGINIIKERLCNKRVLLVLDDVDELIQLESLSGEHEWFGMGSRIIITTRDEHLLTNLKVDFRYKMNGLNQNEALELFSRHAFQSDKPSDDFVELTQHALHYATGLPLAITVLGSYLNGRDKYQWKSALEKYKRIPNNNIHEKLKISYDGLEESEKNIFLDIACFFKGESVEYVTAILDSRGFFPNIGLKVLMDKSLLTIDEFNRLVIHDLLQDMGREIVRQESPQKPGKRSRLWFHEDVRYVLEENMGTNNIEGILVELPKRDLIHWSFKTFEKMKRLKIFISRNANFSKMPNSLPNELIVLDWVECPLESLPSNFHGRKLTILRMRNGLFKGLKEGFQNLPNLSIMELIGLENLTEIPDISRIPNLQELHVFECRSLVKVNDSVGFLDKLTDLHFSGCSNLITLPRSLKLRSLETLRFHDCAKLQNFPEIECKMERLEQFVLRGIAIKELPSSIVYFTGLAFFEIGDCKNLTHLLPSSLQLQPLNILGHERCSKVDKLPTKVRDERESMSTEESEISSSRKLFASPSPANACIFHDGCSSTGFPALQLLYLNKCTRLVKPEFFMTLNCFSGLDRLVLLKSDIVRLPACIKRFVRLRDLFVRDCKQLKEIPELPPSIEYLEADGCVSLESFPDLSKILQFNTSGLQAVKWIGLSECYKLAVNIEGNQVENTLLDKGPYNDYYSGGGIVFPGNRIPAAWFSHRKEKSYGGNSCAIDINGLSSLDEIKGIAFCAVFGPILVDDLDEDYVDLSFAISSKGIGIETRPRCIKLPTVLRSNHVWLEYLVLERAVLEEDNLQVRFLLSLGLFIHSCGVHLIHKHEENAKDHPSLTHVDFNFCLEYSDGEIEDFHSSTSENESDEESENPKCSAEEDDCDEIERVLDGIQPSKRQRDDDDEDDCNLESSSNPQLKKRSSTMGVAQLNQSNHSQHFSVRTP